jgi:hypothetical protein
MESPEKKNIIFCTECGRELDFFAFSENTKDKETLKQKFANCRENGKFKGEFCSKLFIALDYNVDDIFDVDKPL